MRKIFYLVPLLVLSCSEDDVIKPYKNTLAGNYRIASVTTDIPLDINLDGVESTNYYEELSGLHYFNGKEADGVIMTNLNSYGFQAELRDRKSTRLNSSHVKISYAVFCLKKKKIDTTTVVTDTT